MSVETLSCSTAVSAMETHRFKAKQVAQNAATLYKNVSYFTTVAKGVSSLVSHDQPHHTRRPYCHIAQTAPVRDTPATPLSRAFVEKQNAFCLFAVAICDVPTSPTCALQTTLVFV